MTCLSLTVIICTYTYIMIIMMIIIIIFIIIIIYSYNMRILHPFEITLKNDHHFAGKVTGRIHHNLYQSCRKAVPY